MKKNLTYVAVTATLLAGISGCAIERLPSSPLVAPAVDNSGNYMYRIGPGDVVSIFVWGNADVSGDYSVRPDGRISMALTDAVVAAGKTTVELESELSESLSKFLRNPKVTVTIRNASGNLVEQVKVIGKATQPVAMPFTHGMTLMDLMIRIGGLTRYADGNDATLIRVVNGERIEYPIRIKDLMIEADLEENVDLMPGDIIRIPEAWF